MKTVQRLYLNCELTLNSRANTYFLDYFWHGSGVFLLNAVDPRQNMFRECIHRRVGCSPGRVPFKYFCLGGGGGGGGWGVAIVSALLGFLDVSGGFRVLQSTNTQCFQAIVVMSYIFEIFFNFEIFFQNLVECSEESFWSSPT
jgi:hypothetical protein